MLFGDETYKAVVSVSQSSYENFSFLIHFGTHYYFLVTSMCQWSVIAPGPELGLRVRISSLSTSSLFLLFKNGQEI